MPLNQDRHAILLAASAGRGQHALLAPAALAAGLAGAFRPGRRWPSLAEATCAPA